MRKEFKLLGNDFKGLSINWAKTGTVETGKSAKITCDG
jgi:hypothetical protein